MDWQTGRAEHLQLSQAAAEHYDELYADSNFATGSYMDYEVRVLEKWLKEAPDQELAVDLGCGTGRDSFVLAKRFDQVFAYDFAPNMISVAIRRKLRRSVGNVLFEVADVDRDPLEVPPGSVSIVNSAFGMGSFVENLDQFFREVRRVLKPQGIAIFSFYNAGALVNGLNLQWRPALAARVVEKDTLRVDFGGEEYDVAARAYSVPEVKRKIEGSFSLLSLTTFPTLSALFPQELFADPAARKLCTNVDQHLAENLEIAAGPYIVAIGRREGRVHEKRDLSGYEWVLKLLRQHGITPLLRHHGPVKNMDEVSQVIDSDLGELVKSIIVAVTDDPRRDPLHPQLFLFCIPADRKLDFSKVASYLGKPKNSVGPATPSQVEDITGFTVGSIPPFGMPKFIPVILDQSLAAKRRVWCGTGKPTESLRISIDELQRLSAYSIADVSKAAGAS
ncbi:prolyl-tRNA editing enzyme YbaK/EbsC (Cys-tRNA(Pro) deacylase) [Streptomyces sp. Ag82_O1-15]|uniref:YbaK/EbsC family protein n=1 Tax=Streptomyces sp. Ag82_O1-15 TaxID=1938855 RepID=UPI000BB11572|nr:YbaK/EbsC family protein [Streptomyces sp. Ag82_O1-15]PBC96182.1 prolyl-tRNA editing enzyme YbaK/EbsC (Cys-tRNA(Pro) deacylase) [Streptomyces sp. Ag82_O1-15]PBC96205.1 prolyl-tRNA editing enzyme YbaK/EbsC (Cys-tRNA(Pro) deacylase) [Streptomyces sp. Ag82_O1-15]